jgi:GAF domain-containing protein
MLAGIAQLVTQPQGWGVAGMAGAVVAAIGGIVVAITEQDASSDLERARAAIAQAKEFEDEALKLDAYKQDVRKATELYSALRTMREVLEISVQIDGKTLSDVIDDYYKLARRSLLIALGFELEEHWTVCIYKAEAMPGGGKIELACVRHERTVDCKVEEARRWPEGVGVAGYAYSNNKEIIVPDLNDPALGTTFNLGERARDYDEVRYRSIAAIPIRVSEKIWGIAVATSSRPGHFLIHSDEGGIQAAEGLRALAGMIALAVAVKEKPV